MSARFHRALQDLLNNWKAICLVISVFGSLGMYLTTFFIPSLKVRTEWFIGFGYLGGVAFVLLLLELQSTLRQQKLVNEFVNMKAAEPAIREAILRASRRRLGTPVNVRILGMRLTNISTILYDLLHVVRNNEIGRRDAEIRIYHISPDYLETYSPAEGNSNRWQRFQTQASLVRSITKELENTFEKVSKVRITRCTFCEVPYLWAFDIDGEEIFWGYFLWDLEDNNWFGPENNCFHVHRRQQPFTEFFEWIENRMDFFDQLNTVQTEPLE
jgi:hypothetical protein